MLGFDFLFVISVPVYLIFLLIHIKRKISIRTIVIHSLFYFYILGVIALTLFPLPIQRSVIEEGINNAYFHNNFIPFHSILDIISRNEASVILKQIGGNIVLGIPLGFLVPLIWKNQNGVLKILKIGFLFSLGIEATQFLISLFLEYTYKITDIDDILLNSIGCMLGYVLLKSLCINKKLQELFIS